jgi:hypothetical protein
MSFIDMTKSDVWSEDDIINRTEAIIANKFPKHRLDILSRKVQGQAMGYVLTAQEQADLMDYQAVCYHAGAEADLARADMALLTAVLAHEVLMRRLAQEPQPELVDDQPNPLYEQDAAERADATIKVANASPEVVALYELRNPVVEAPVEPVEVIDEVVA